MNDLVELLKSKNPIIIPTDVGFELICDASATESVELVRGAFVEHSATSYAIVVGNIDQLGRYIREFPEMAIEVMEIAESPLNVVLPNAINVSEMLKLPNGSAPFRVVKKGLIHDLAIKTNRALLAVPACQKGMKVPAKADDVDPELSKYLVSGNEGSHSFTGKLPSVLDIYMNGIVKVLRD